jgi:hypothetical protein
MAEAEAEAEAQHGKHGKDGQGLREFFLCCYTAPQLQR